MLGRMDETRWARGDGARAAASGWAEALADFLREIPAELPEETKGRLVMEYLDARMVARSGPVVVPGEPSGDGVPVVTATTRGYRTEFPGAGH